MESHITQVNDRDRLILLRRRLNFRWNAKVPSRGLVMLVLSRLTSLLGGRQKRIEFMQWVFGNNELVSASQLDGQQLFALVYWAKPIRRGRAWQFSPQFESDCLVLNKLLKQEDN